MATDVYKYKVEIDQQSMRNQMMQMHQAVQASSMMSSPSMTQNAMGYGSAMSLGMNSIMQDLRGTMSMLPRPSMPGSETSGSMVNMSAAQSIAALKYGAAPNTMRVSQYQQLAREDLRYRASAMISQGTLGIAKSALRWAPAMAGGAMGAASAVAGGSGVAGTLWGGATGALTMGGMATASVAGLAVTGGIAVGVAAGAYYADEVHSQLKNRYRTQNMLFSASGGKMGHAARTKVSGAINRMVIDEADFSSQEGTELLAYGTEAELLDANQNSDEYQRNYKSLLKSVKTIMSTMHQSVKEAVGTMKAMKSSGILNPDEYGTTAIMLESRAALSGMSKTRLLQEGVVGAGIGGRTNMGTRTGMQTQTFGIAAAKMLFNPTELLRETNLSGPDALSSMGAGLTTAMGQFASGRTGFNAALGLIDTETGRIDKDKLIALNEGRTSMSDLMVDAADSAAGLTNIQATQMGKRAYENMSGQMGPVLMATMARRWATDTRGMDPTNEADLVAAARAMGVSDPRGAAMVAKLALDPNIISRMRTKRTRLGISDRINTLDREGRLGVRAKKYIKNLAADSEDLIHTTGDEATAEAEQLFKHYYGDKVPKEYIGGIMGAGDVANMSNAESSYGNFTSDIFGQYVGDVVPEPGIIDYITNTQSAVTTLAHKQNIRRKREFKSYLRKNLPNISEYAKDPSKFDMKRFGSSDNEYAEAIRDYVKNEEPSELMSASGKHRVADSLGDARKVGKRIYNQMSEEQQLGNYGLSLRALTSSQNVHFEQLSGLKKIMSGVKSKSSDGNLLSEILGELTSSNGTMSSPEQRSQKSFNNKKVSDVTNGMSTIIRLLDSIDKRQKE